MGASQRQPDGGSPHLTAATDERNTLMGVCYRLLGTVADAEDAVQETYVRWYRLTDRQRAGISVTRAWLIKTASRICLDMLGTARSRHETYVGEWLPEPLPGGASPMGASGTDPSDRISLDESVSMALMVVLKAMTPPQRVAFVLHDVFGYSFSEIAEVVGRTPQACRQLAVAARRRMAAGHASEVPRVQHDALVRSFRQAWQDGDLTRLIDVLDPHATAITDGGGMVHAAAEPLRGATDIASFFIAVRDREPELMIDETTVNGALSLIAKASDRVLSVVTFDMTPQQITHVWAMRNPEKLRSWHS